MAVNKIRDKRTISPFREFKVGPVEAAEMVRTRSSAGFTHMLDIMECLVAEEDTALINAEDDAEVLGQHKIAKAAWKFFVKFQKRVDEEIAKGLHQGTEQKTDDIPPKREADLY